MNNRPGEYHSRKYRDALERRSEMGRPKDDGSYKAAVLNACYDAQIYAAQATPGATVKELVKWHRRMALDPETSKEAQALVARGRKEAYARVAATLSVIAAITAAVVCINLFHFIR